MPKRKSLSSLGLHTINGSDPVINKIVFDSRQVEPGCLFAALKGGSAHGANFVEGVLNAGEDEIKKIPGINKTLAEAIYFRFHES